MNGSNQHPVESHHSKITMIRVLGIACLVPVLVFLCLQTGHARLKGTPMETWRLIPMILAAALFALLGKRFLNSFSGLFFGGIGGALGTLNNFAAPFGGVAGLLVGAIVIAIPIMYKTQLNGVTAKAESRQDGDDDQLQA